MSSPRLAQLVEEAARRLADFETGALDAEVLFRGLAGIGRAEFLACRDDEVSPELVARFDDAVERRRRHEPIQYILGVASFWRDEFLVDPTVLIPRPETEGLVEAALSRLARDTVTNVLDIGTGSGCIALSLLRERPLARALATDVSLSALRLATANARRLGLSSRVEMLAARWLDAIRPDRRFDAILSNPPYVPRSDGPLLPRDVREFEPETALFSDETDDLSSYRALATGVAARLRPAGFVALEVGMGQAAEVADLLGQAGLHQVEILDDLARIPRVVIGRRG